MSCKSLSLIRSMQAAHRNGICYEHFGRQRLLPITRACAFVNLTSPFLLLVEYFWVGPVGIFGFLICWASKSHQLYSTRLLLNTKDSGLEHRVQVIA